MSKVFKKITEIFVVSCIIFFIVFIFIFGFALHTYNNVAIAPVILFIAITLFLSWGFLYTLYKASKKPINPHELEREKLVMREVGDIRNGNRNTPQTTIGNLYAAAIIFALLFPIFGYIIKKIFPNPDDQNNILLSAGNICIFIFIVFVILKRNSNK